MKSHLYKNSGNALTRLRRIACAAFLLSSACLFGDTVLTGDSNRPGMNLFIPGESVELIFNATGLPADAKGLKLLLNIVDEHDHSLKDIQVPVTPAANGSWRGSVKAPSDKLGFYRVRAKLSNGVAVAGCFSRGPGYITYGVVVDPAKRQLYPANETYFGMQGGFSPNVQVLPYLGIRWVLGPGSWQRTEPDYPGQILEQKAEALKKGEKFPADAFAWCRYTVDGQEKRWQTYFFLNSIGWSPDKWEKPPFLKESYINGRAVLSPEGEKQFENYCRELAKAMVESYPEQDAHYYEIAWELELFFKGTSKDFLRYFEIAYSTIHAVDPKALIMGPTFSNIQYLSFSDKLLAEGLGKYIDIYSIHPYIGSTPEKSGLPGLCRQLKKKIRECSGKDIPLAGTESGTAYSALDSKVELFNAQADIRADLIKLGEGFIFNTAFYIADHPGANEPAGAGGYGYFYNQHPGVSFGASKTAPKSVAVAYAAMSYLLEGHKSAGAIEWLGDTALGYAYQRADDILLAVWDYGDNPHQVNIPIGVDQAEVFDWMGNGKVVQTQKGILKVTLSREPVYIKGVSPKLWGKDAVHPVKMGQEIVNLFPGSEAVIQCSVTAPKESAMTGQLDLILNDLVKSPATKAEVKLLAGETKQFSFPIQIPEAAPLGPCPVSVNLIQDGVISSAASCMIKVQEPVKIGNLMPIVHGNRNAIKFSVTDEQGKGASGTVGIRLAGVSGSASVASFKVGANATSEVIVPLDGLSVHPARKYEAQSKFVMDSGDTFTKTGEVNFLAAKRFAKSPTIDGNPDDWTDVPYVELKGKEWCTRSPQYYSGDSARIHYGWDDQALYVLVEVRDALFVQEKEGADTWEGDSLQTGFNLDPWKRVVITGNSVADDAAMLRASEIEFALTKKGPQSWLGKHKGDRPDGLLGKDDCQLAVVQKGGLTTYEMAIPWKTLGATEAPKPGNYIGVTLAVNDRDYSEKSKKQSDPSALTLFDGVTTQKDVSLFGLLYLAK